MTQQPSIADTAASPSWRLRPMGHADLDAVMDVELAAYAFPWTRGNFTDALVAGHPSWLLLPGSQHPATGRPVGHAVAMVGVGELHVLNLAVAPSWQGRGGGRRLIEALVAHCGVCRAEALWLEVRVGNARAQRIYTEAGFERIGVRRGYYPAADGRREDAVMMRRMIDLPAP